MLKYSLVYTFLSLAICTVSSQRRSIAENEYQRDVTFLKIANKKFIEQSIMTAMHIRARSYCITECLDQNRCKSIAFNSISGECQLSRVPVVHDHNLLTRTTDDPDWTIYTQLRHPVLNVQSPDGKYTMTFTQAASQCQERGYELASRDDVDNAFLDGLHLCQCGWMTDETNVSVNGRRDKPCPWSYGVTDCDLGLADAWCKKDWN